MPIAHALKADPVRVSYKRAAAFTVIAQASGVLAMSVTLALSPLRDLLAEHELIIHSLALAATVPVFVAFPIAVILQRERLKLAQALQKLAAANELLLHKSRTDALTDLLNRETFMKEMEDRRQNAAHGAMLMIDLDHFKSVNDTFGHQAGDEALILVSRAIRNAVRSRDIVGRLGGEEFGVFIPGEDESFVLDIAERIRREVARIEFRPEPGHLEPLTVSIGLAYEPGNVSSKELIAIADGEMYTAKDSGRNRVSFDSAA